MKTIANVLRCRMGSNFGSVSVVKVFSWRNPAKAPPVVTLLQKRSLFNLFTRGTVDCIISRNTEPLLSTS